LIPPHPLKLIHLEMDMHVNYPIGP
jgi:hypothetical protein